MKVETIKNQNYNNVNVKQKFLLPILYTVYLLYRLPSLLVCTPRLDFQFSKLTKYARCRCFTVPV